MKYFPRTLLSTLLAVGTAASLVLSPLAAVIGSDLYAYDSDIHKGTVLSHGVYWGATANDKRTENYISYTPSADVTPIVTYGSKVTSTSTVSSAARATTVSVPPNRFWHSGCCSWAAPPPYA